MAVDAIEQAQANASRRRHSDLEMRENEQVGRGGGGEDDDIMMFEVAIVAAAAIILLLRMMPIVMR